MKYIVQFIGVILVLLVSFSAPTQANKGHEVIFDGQFIQAHNPNPGRPFGLRSVVLVDDVFYAYLGNTIYAWKSGDSQPVKYCSLPQAPEWNDAWKSTPLKDLPSQEQTKLEQSVDYIVGGNGTVWGYNLISGKIGKISENGITWQDQTLDTTSFFKNGLVTLYFVPTQSFVNEGYLYIFGDNDGIKELGSDKPLLRFDLSNGEYIVMDTEQARNICAYQPDSVLLAQKNDSTSMKLSIMNLKTGNIENLPLTIPFPDRSDEYRSSIGGLAYNAEDDSIYFVFGETPLNCNVWQSKGGNPFQSVMQLNVFAHSNVLGWTIHQRQYAFFVMDGLYICTLD